MNLTLQQTLTQNKKPMIWILIPSLIGNILEWYDFALYGYFASILSKLFFPTQNPAVALIATFSVFAVGFIMRPIGALLFGYFGDRIGRKKTLGAAVLLMAIPTTLIGLLPTYQQIGITATILLTVCRLMQGLAVGGELTGSVVYLIEHGGNKNRGLYGSLALGSGVVGLLLGSAVAAFVGSLSNDETFISWSWRIPFLMSVLLGVIGLYLRLGMPETPLFEQIQERKKITQNPIFSAFRQNAWRMTLGTIMTMLPSAAFYTSFVYLSSYLTLYLNVPLTKALELNSIAMVVVSILFPVVGVLSDKVGRRFVIRLGAIGFVIFSYPLFMLLQQATTAAILIAQCSFAVLVALSYSAIAAMLVEFFPTDIRYTAISFPYNIANAFFGGTAPLIVTTLIQHTNNYLAPSFWLIFLALIVIVSSLYLPETKDNQLI